MGIASKIGDRPRTCFGWRGNCGPEGRHHIAYEAILVKGDESASRDWEDKQLSENVFSLLALCLPAIRTGPPLLRVSSVC